MNGRESGLRYGQVREDLPYGKTIVRGECFVTGRAHHIIVDTAGLDAWLGGGPLIQIALPGATDDEREFLLSGTSPAGWALVFPDE